MGQKRIRAVVDGYVQGVGYRWFTVRAANRLGIYGWVRNNYDGSVETVAEGPVEAVNEFILELKKGPMSAVVKNVILSEDEPQGGFDSFDIKF